MKQWHYCIKPPGKRKSEGYVEARSERAAKIKLRARRKVKRLQGLVFFRQVWLLDRTWHDTYGGWDSVSYY
jgi:hypothetical protein